MTAPIATSASEESGERDPLGDRADDDVARGLHEHDLEQEQHHHADVVRAVALQEEAVHADDARAAVAEDPGQRRHAAEVRDRCDAAELNANPTA